MSSPALKIVPVTHVFWMVWAIQDCSSVS